MGKSSSSPRPNRYHLTPPHFFIVTPPSTLIIPTAYLGPVWLYAYLLAVPHCMEDRGEHYVKQTCRTRCHIATPQGVQALTVPVDRSGGSHTAVRDLRLSSHGNWRHLHWQALTSAYERTPYFEYFADEFHTLYQQPFTFLADFNAALHEAVCRCLDLTLPRQVSLTYVQAEAHPHSLDLRQHFPPKAFTPGLLHADTPAPFSLTFRAEPYYQVFASRTGFLPHLSIVDLLFNLGPESRLLLRRSLVPQA